MELYKSSAYELLNNLAKKEVTAQDITLSLKKRIKETDSKVRAYVRINESSKEALKPEGDNSILKGIPVSIKDNICTEGLNTECCSRILSGFKPP